MIYGGIIAPPALQRGINHTCCIHYGLFIHTHTHVHSLPFGIIWENWSGKWRVFLIQPLRIIPRFMKLSSWRHESHWHMLPWIFIICLFVILLIFLRWLCHDRVVVPSLKATSQYSHECPGITSSACWFHWCFIVLDLFSAYTAAFLTKGSLWIPWWLVFVGGLGRSCTHSYIINSLTSGLKLLKRLQRYLAGTLHLLVVNKFWRETVYKTHLTTD